MFTIVPGVSHHVIMNDETSVAIVPHDFYDVAERIVRSVNTSDESIRLLLEANDCLKRLGGDTDLIKRINQLIRRYTS